MYLYCVPIDYRCYLCGRRMSWPILLETNFSIGRLDPIVTGVSTDFYFYFYYYFFVIYQLSIMASVHRRSQDNILHRGFMEILNRYTFIMFIFVFSFFTFMKSCITCLSTKIYRK